MSNLRLLHVANTAGLASGGIGEVVHGLLRAQARRGGDVRLWFPGTEQMAGEVRALTGLEPERVRAVRHVRILNNVVPYGLVGATRQARECNLVHQHGIWVPNSIFVAHLAGRGVRTVISPHGLLEPDRLRIASGKKRLIARLYENRNLARAACFVACSEQEAQGIRQFGLRQPIAVIPNGVADELFVHEAPPQRARQEFRARHQLPAEARVLLFLSRVHPLKGLDLLLDAVTELATEMRQARWVLAIAGPSELGHREQLEARVAQAGLGDIVRFLPPLHQGEKFTAYHDASFFVLPSLNENFGIVVAEALACALPVLTTRGTPWQALASRRCGFWIERNAAELVAHLRRILTLSDTELREMGRNGRMLAEQQFRWDSIAGQFGQLYEWVQGRADRPAFVQPD